MALLHDVTEHDVTEVEIKHLNKERRYCLMIKSHGYIKL